jgi:hypothetical protein
MPTEYIYRGKLRAGGWSVSGRVEVMKRRKTTAIRTILSLWVIGTGLAFSVTAFAFPANGLARCEFRTEARSLIVVIDYRETSDPRNRQIVGGHGDVIEFNGTRRWNLGVPSGLLVVSGGASSLIVFPEIKSEERWGDPVEEPYAVRLVIQSSPFMPPGTPGQCVGF